MANALGESFFGTLDAELVERQSRPTRRAVRLAVFEWIERFDNRQRRHPAPAELSPVAFEAIVHAVLSRSDDVSTDWGILMRMIGATFCSR